MQIHGLQKTTLLDYPGKVACTLFTGSCQFRCPFCHNAGLVLQPSRIPAISEDEIMTFLHKRKGILQGVCITGGEPTLQQDLIPFIRNIKDLGYAVKLDTNGYQPDVLQELLDLELLDMVAMDVKSCLADYPVVTGIPTLDTSRIKQSLELLSSGKVFYELRTTILPTFHSKESLCQLAREIQGCEHYFLQTFRNGDIIAGTEFPVFTTTETQEILMAIRQWLPQASLRGDI